MGDFRIVIDAVGNHGCTREANDGDIITGCGQANCADCIAREFVKRMRDSYAASHSMSARLEHWPKVQENGAVRTDDQVGPIDDLVTGKRRGSFKTQPMLPPDAVEPSSP